MKPKAYSYVRMSTESQLKGDSLRRQTELSQRYAESNALDLVDDTRLHDIGVSAFKGDNVATGALGRFLDALKAGKIEAGSYFLVESLDRLSRDKVTTAMAQFLSILEAGVNIVTLADNQVYLAGKTHDMQLMMSLVIMSRANEESETKSKRISAAWEAKRAGIADRKLTTISPLWLRLAADRKSFHLDDERVSVVRRIFALASDGLGVWAITKTLNKETVSPFGRSKGWNESYVEKILKSRAVLGEFQPRVRRGGSRVPTGEPIKGYYPAVIDEDLFLSVQAARRARGHVSGGRRGENTANLFSHLATCGYCGEPMRVINKGAGKGRYLKCSTSAKGLPCSPKGWRYADFETSFLFFVQELDLAEMLKTAAERAAEGQFATKLAAERERLREIEKLRDRSYEVLLSLGDNAYVAKKLAEYEGQIAAVSARIDALVQPKAPQPAVASQGALLDQIKLVSSTSSPEVGPVRARLATRLKEMIAELRVEAEGSRPRLADTKAFLTSNEPDEAIRNQMIQTLDAVAQRSGSENPTFQVVFVNGVQRRVVVDPDDPTKFKSEVYVSGSERLVRRPGEDDWHASRPLSESEIDHILAAADAGSAEAPK